MFKEISFANIEFLWFLLVIPLMILWYYFRNKDFNAEVNISTISAFKNLKPTVKTFGNHILFVIRLLSVFFLIIALARPQTSLSREEHSTEGIDIMIAMDVSTSMLALDFKPDRIRASIDVANDFIDNRPTDRIGLVLFGGESFVQCPLTTEHRVLKNLFRKVKCGMIKDGTAIGVGLSTAIRGLKDSKAKSKVIILLTDGENNQGNVTPVDAAKMAKTFGIRVYTIGVGRKGMVNYPGNFGMIGQMESKIDEETLQEMADITNGKYFLATKKEKLEEVYNEIDKLEKTITETIGYTKKNEEFFPLVLIAGILLLTEILLKNTVFRTTP